MAKKNLQNVQDIEISKLNNQLTVSSLQVAKHFEKRHDDVLKAIRNILPTVSKEFRDRNFAETFITVEMPNNASRQDPAYSLTKDGFMFVSMGFTGKKAMEMKVQYIEAFNNMEATLHKQINNAQLRIEPAVEPIKLEMLKDHKFPFVCSLEMAKHFNKAHEELVLEIEKIISSAPFEWVSRYFKNSKMLEHTDGLISKDDNVFYYISYDGFIILTLHINDEKGLEVKQRYLKLFVSKLEELENHTPLKAAPPRNRLYVREDCAPGDITIIEGLIDYWCYVKNLSREEALEQVHVALSLHSLNDLQVFDYGKAFMLIWGFIHRIKKDGSALATEEDLRPVQGLISVWVDHFGYCEEDAIGFICKQCNIKSLKEIPKNAIPQVVSAVWLAIGVQVNREPSKIEGMSEYI